MPFLDESFELVGGREVDLVDDDYCRYPAGGYALDYLGRAVALLDGVGDIEYDVRIAYGALDELHHRLLQLVARFEYSRSVGVYYLEIFTVDYAHYTVTGGLCFRCYD